MMNAFVRLISRYDIAEERISELKARTREITQIEKEWEKVKIETEQTIQECWDHIKHSNICIIWILLRGEWEKGRGKGGRGEEEEWDDEEKYLKT